MLQSDWFIWYKLGDGAWTWIPGVNTNTYGHTLTITSIVCWGSHKHILPGVPGMRGRHTSSFTYNWLLFTHNTYSQVPSWFPSLGASWIMVSQCLVHLSLTTGGPWIVLGFVWFTTFPLTYMIPYSLLLVADSSFKWELGGSAIVWSIQRWSKSGLNIIW
jgi:hypothetical protein